MGAHKNHEFLDHQQEVEWEGKVEQARKDAQFFNDRRGVPPAKSAGVGLSAPTPRRVTGSGVSAPIPHANQPGDIAHNTNSHEK